MALYDLADRLNWQQACEILGCSKAHLYRLVQADKIPMYGTGKRFRWFLRLDCERLLGEELVLDNGSLKVTIQPKEAGTSNVCN